MEATQANGTVLHTRAETNVRGAKTFVFINSLGTDFRIWDGVAERLRGRFNLVLHDKRGHGLSAIGGGGATIKTYAGDLEDLLAEISATNIVLCGLSVGGLIAQHILLHGRTKIACAVLSNTGLKVGTHETWNARIASVESAGLDSIADGVMEKWFSPAFRTSRPDRLSLYRTMLARTDRDGYIACCKAIRDAATFAHGSHGSGGVPVLCLGGSLDGSTPPEVVKAMARHIPHARYHEFEGAGHLPCVEQPVLYADIIARFAEEA